MLLRLIAHTGTNALLLYIASQKIAGFSIAPGLENLFVVAAIFTALYLFVRPLAKLILGPLIVLTLGLGILLINAGMLILLDFLSVRITIEGIVPLSYATLLITALNVFVSIVLKPLLREKKSE